VGGDLLCCSRHQWDHTHPPVSTRPDVANSIINQQLHIIMLCVVVERDLCSRGKDPDLYRWIYIYIFTRLGEIRSVIAFPSNPRKHTENQCEFSYLHHMNLLERVTGRFSLYC